MSKSNYLTFENAPTVICVHFIVVSEQGAEVAGGSCSLQALCLWGEYGYNYTLFIPPPLLFWRTRWPQTPNSF